MSNPSLAQDLPFFFRLVAAICVATVLISVYSNFVRFGKKQAENERKSIVATATMVGFFIFYCIILMHRAWVIPLFGGVVGYFRCAGIFMMVIGAIVNVWGRVNLANNWSDQIIIFKNHELLSTGVFAWVRHPLYASLIVMFYGGSFLYHNWAAFLVTSLIFVPSMYFRAKQEEELLEQKFADYKKYKDKTGMFFPKILG